MGPLSDESQLGMTHVYISLVKLFFNIRGDINIFCSRPYFLK